MTGFFKRSHPFANVAAAQLNTVVVTAGSFVVTPAILFGLGDSAYGGWLLINSFTSYIRLLDLGASAGTVKFGAGAYARGDRVDLARVLNTSAAIFLSIASLALVVTFVLMKLLPALYPNIAGSQQLAIVTLGAAIAFDLLFRPLTASLRMRSLHFVYETIEICTYSVFKLGMVLYFAYRREISYGILSSLTFYETTVRISLVACAALLLTPEVRRVNPLSVDRDMAYKLALMGGAVSVIQVADIVRFQLDAGVIGYFLPDPQSISIFGVGTRLASISYAAVGVIGSVLIPRFSGLSETGEKEGVENLLRRSSLITGLFASFILVNLAVLGPQFLELWLHKPWIHTSGRILLIVLPAYYVALLTGPAAAVLVGHGKLRGLTILTVAEAVANFVLSVLLVRPLGIFGVALGTAIPLAFFRGIVFPFLLRAEIGYRVSDYARMHSRAILIGVVYLVLVGGLMLLGLPTYARFFLIAAGSTVVFVLLAFAAFPLLRSAALIRLGQMTKRVSL